MSKLANEARPRGAAAFTLVELMIVVSIIGLLAAVAIPAFVKYRRRSMTVEATFFLRQLSDGTMAYWAAEHTDGNGVVLPQQLPLYDLVASSGREIPLWNWRCTVGNNHYNPTGKYNPSLFSYLVSLSVPMQAYFNAVNFWIDEPHYYSVFANNGAIANGTMLGALSDLNCNGVVGYHLRYLVKNSDGSLRGSAIQQLNPLE